MNNQQIYNYITQKIKSINTRNYVTWDSREYICRTFDNFLGNKEYRAKTLAELKEIVDKEIK